MEPRSPPRGCAGSAHRGPDPASGPEASGLCGSPRRRRRTLASDSLLSPVLSRIVPFWLRRWLADPAATIRASLDLQTWPASYVSISNQEPASTPPRHRRNSGEVIGLRSLSARFWHQAGTTSSIVDAGRPPSGGLGGDVLAGFEECGDELAGSRHARQVVPGYLEDLRPRN